MYQNFHITNKALIIYKNKLLFAKSNDPEYFGALECPGGIDITSQNWTISGKAG